MGTTPASLRRRLEVRIRVLTMLSEGLSGHPFHWGAGESSNYFPIARELGCTLKTKTAIKRAGLVLKRGAKPVGRAYYGAPIKDYCEIYIVETHADTSTGKTLTREANDENT